MKNVLPAIFILAVALPLFGAPELVIFKNGEKISGEVVERSDAGLALKTPYGTIQIPSDAVESVAPVSAAPAVPAPAPQAEVASAPEAPAPAESAAQPAPASAPAAPEPQAPAHPPSQPPAAIVAADPAVIPPDPLVPSPPAAAPAPEPDTRPWEERYRDFIHSIVPEGWTFRIRGGIGYQSSTSRSTSYSFGFEGRKSWADVNEFAMFANYDYTLESPDNSPSYKSTDKFVSSALYKRYISKENNWFISNTLTYSYDKIKGINHQADEIVAAGYTFKFLDGEIVLNVSAGPSVRFINAVDYDRNWVLMGTVMEDMTWRFHKYARLEQRQSAFAGFNAMNPKEYNLIFNIGIIFEISDLLNIAGRYSYNYDGINASTAQKADQRLTLGFEIPLK